MTANFMMSDVRARSSGAPRVSGLCLGVTIVALQRFALPLGGDQAVPVTIVVIVAFLFAMLVSGAAAIRPVAATVFAFFVAYAALVTAIFEASIMGMLLVLAIWWPICVRTEREWVQQFLRGMLLTTAFGGAFGVVQSVMTAIGLPLIDPIAQTPSTLLVAGFNDSYEVVWGSGWMKANGGLFLEPSALSMFCALNLVVLASGAVTVRRGHAWLICALLIGGLLSSVAASGLVVLPALLIALARSRRTIVAVVSAAVISPLAMTLPQARAFIDRLVASEGTSNEARLIRPYGILVPEALERSPILGLGAGSARRYTQENFIGWENEVTTPTVAKMLFEYGLIGLVFLILAVLSLLAAGGINAAVKLALVLVLLVPTDGLASALIAPAVILASSAARESFNGLATRQRRSGRRPAAADNSVRVA